MILYIMFLLILLSGDIELNPGPSSVPKEECPICQKSFFRLQSHINATHKEDNYESDCDSSEEEVCNSNIIKSWYELSDFDIDLWVSCSLQLPTGCTFVPPAIVHLLHKGSEDVALRMIREEMRLQNYAFILLVMNNKINEEEEENCHWSLLVFDVCQNKSFHFDSKYPINNLVAKQMTGRLSKCILGRDDINTIEVDCLQQRGSVECGVYCLHFAKIVCGIINRDSMILDNKIYKHDFRIDCIYDEIEHLKKQQLRVSNELPEQRKKTSKKRWNPKHKKRINCLIW
jgi:hypothetical protein